VPIQLDKERHIRFGYRVIAEAEEILGRPFPTLSLSNLGIREWHALIWASLKDDDESLTSEDIYDFMDEYGLDTITVKMIEAINIAWPKPKNKSKNKKKSGKKK